MLRVCFGLFAFLLLFGSVGVIAGERLVIALGDKNNGFTLEVVDLANLTVVATGPMGPRPVRQIVISLDRRFALTVHEHPGFGSLFSVGVSDLTQKTLPMIAKLGTGTVSKRIAVTPDGATAVVAGFQANNPQFPPELLFIDLRQSPPTTLGSWLVPGLSSAFDVDLSAGGQYAYLVDNHASLLGVVDITQTPPVVANLLPIAWPRSLRVSPDGGRLVMPYQDKTVSVWDLASPRTPVRRKDGVFSDLLILEPPIFESGGSFAVTETAWQNYGNTGRVYTVDYHSDPPRILGSVGVGTRTQQSMGVFTLTTDGLSAWRSMHPVGQLEEIDLSSVTAPKPARSTLKLYPTWAMAAFGEMHTQGPARIGSSYPVVFSSPGDAGKPFLMAASFAARPGFPIGSRRIPLGVDALFVASRTLPAVFQSFTGTLNLKGHAVGRIHLPNVPALRGLGLYVAGVTVDPAAPFGIGTISNAVHIVVR